jgi:hypothetical protein
MICRTDGCRRAPKPDSPYCRECRIQVALAPFARREIDAVPLRRIAAELGMTGRAR